MKQMIYEVYVILPLLLLWRAQFCGKEEWNEGFLSLEQSKAFQGFLAVCIMLHHIGQKTCAPWLQPKTRIVHGLDMFVPAGFLMVAVFLFFNGYGVYKSFHAKENYLKGYFGRRILPVVLALYSTTLIFFVVRLLVGEKIEGMQIVYYLTSLKLCNPNTWYVIVLPFFYLFFYLAFRLIKKDGLAVLFVCLLVLGYMLLGTSIDHNSWWIRGEWWYNCAALFPVGILFAKYEDRIIPHLKKHYRLYLLVTVLGFLPLYLGTDVVVNMFSYYGENWGAPDTVFRRRVCLLAQSVLCTDFVFAWLLLGMKVKIGNPFLKFMGKITLEFYLIHGVFVELFDHTFDGGVKSPFPIKNVFLYVVAVFVLGVPSAVLLQKFHHLVLGKKSGKTKDAK